MEEHNAPTWLRRYFKMSNNTNIGKKNLEINKKNIFHKGYGLFKKTHKDLILT